MLARGAGASMEDSIDEDLSSVLSNGDCAGPNVLMVKVVTDSWRTGFMEMVVGGRRQSCCRQWSLKFLYKKHADM